MNGRELTHFATLGAVHTRLSRRLRSSRMQLLLTLLLALVPVNWSIASGPLAVHAATGDLVGTATFSQQCGGFQGIGVGVTFDGTNLWYSCAESTPDLLRADPHTGHVSASYTIGGGIGALAYDSAHNVIYAGWGNFSNVGKVYSIQLDAARNVSSSAVKFSAPDAVVCGLDDGLAYDGSNDTIYISDDCSTTIHHYDTFGNQLNFFGWAGAGCYNSGLALGNQLIFEGADGCNTVYVVDKSAPQTVQFQFSTVVGGDPNFRDEGLTCDTSTFPGMDVMWSKEAYSPARAHAFQIPTGSCGVGGQPASRFDWQMVNRWSSTTEFGVQVPIFPSTISPATYGVTLNACGSVVIVGTYTWISSTGASVVSRSCVVTMQLPLGLQTITLTTTPNTGQPVTSSEQINVRDLLIVGIGDSVASGEGNPDIPGNCQTADAVSGKIDFTSCDSKPIWWPEFPSPSDSPLQDPTINQNYQCHRSNNAGSEHFAHDLQAASLRGDAHYSVTFLSVACSGASINQGLLGPWNGVPPRPEDATPKPKDLPAQIDQLRQLIGVNQATGKLLRTPDAVILTVGGDDVGFASVLTACLSGPNGRGNTFDHCSDPGSPTGDKQLKEVNRRLGLMAGNFANFANCFSDLGNPCVVSSKKEAPLGIPSSRLWITQYFDASRDDSGQLCDYSVVPILSTLSPADFQWANTNIVAPLENQISTAASAHGWNVLPVYSDFYTHGICATDHWLNQWDEEFQNQGDKQGFFHPNHNGQDDYFQKMQQLVAPALLP